VCALLRAEHFDDEVCETIDDRGLPVEAGRRVDHAEDSRPGSNSIQVTELALQASQYRQPGQPCRCVGLLERYLAPDLAQRLRERAIGIGRPVTRNQRSCANDPDPRKRQNGARRKLQWCREHKTKVLQPLIYF
jgi:hypothetical protein